VKLRLLSVGKPRDPLCSRLHDRYAARLARLGVGYESSWIADARPRGRPDAEEVRRREAEELLERLDGPGTLVALDVAGVALTSEGLARRLERWSTPRASFVVGGPLGLHRRVLDRSDERWSLSPLTLPHEMVRAIVVEQVYRAVTVLRHLPYHK
jgi:23S rRNA (pseudouridine1915-N3)-methyltransferase